MSDCGLCFSPKFELPDKFYSKKYSGSVISPVVDDDYYFNF